MMKFTRSDLFPEVIILEPKIYKDDRGHFFEGFQKDHYFEAGIKDTFVQDNYSRSARGCLRGLHYQLKSPQAKLVGVTSGKVFDVIVDIRQGSPTFLKWRAYELSDANARQIFVPKGFAHGFFVLSDYADFYYKCSDFYNPNDEHGIAWNDSSINIKWPLNDAPILSAKDKTNGFINKILKDRLPEYA